MNNLPNNQLIEFKFDPDIHNLTNMERETQAWELFLNTFENNDIFQDLIYDHYFTHEDHWMQKEYGRRDFERLEEIFDELLEKDYEATLHNAMQFAFYLIIMKEQ